MANLVYIGLGGTVLALDRTTGSEVWRTELKGDFVTVAVLDGDLFAGAKGELYCLDGATGKVRWRNTLKGLGRGLMSIAAAGQQTVLAREKKRREEQDSAALQAGIG